MVDSAETHYKQGVEFYKAKKYDEAIAEFKKAIKLNPNYERAYQKIVDVCKEAKKLDEAATYFEELIAKYPKKSYPYFAHGSVFAEKKEYQRAIESYKKSIRLSPQFAAVYINLAKTFRDSKNLDEGVQFMNAFVKANPKNPYAHFGLASAYELQTKWNLALENLEKAMQVNVKLADAYLIKGNIYQNIGRFKDALPIYEYGLELVKTEKDAFLQSKFLGNIGVAYISLGDNSNGLKYLGQAATKKEKPSAEIHRNRRVSPSKSFFRRISVFSVFLDGFFLLFLQRLHL